MKILVLAANGMIGSTVFRVLSQNSEWEVSGSVRAKSFDGESIAHVFTGVDLSNHDHLVGLFRKAKPDVVINCAGLTKHLPGGNEAIPALTMNALLPHRLAELCAIANARLIHVSTDCVFSGDKGGYVEEDFADACDVYGKSKVMGEVDYPHAITLRTSTIGHEWQTKYGLLEWFLSQNGSCKGYKGAVFSGLPTVVFSEVIRDVVIPRAELHGLYHVGAEPINKYDLLQLIAKIYGKQIDIEMDEGFVINRSLNSERFRLATGYKAPNWEDLIKTMHAYQ